jgi:hypothetical protein
MTRNVTSYPKSCNLKVKLAFLQEMKEDKLTQENEKVWDAFILKTKDEMKRQVLKQGECIVKFLEEKRLALFHERVLTIAEGYFTWFSEVEGLEALPPLSHHGYGALSIYCYFNSTVPNSPVFRYLCKDQEALLKAFKKKYLTTMAGNPLFSNEQLQESTLFLPGSNEPSLPLRLSIESPNRESERNVTQPPSQESEATTNHTPPPHPPFTRDLEHIIYKVKDKIYDLVPALFWDLATSVETSQREETAMAKLEATIKTKKALNIAKLLDTDMAMQRIVAPENMEHLVNTLVDKRIETKGKQAQNKFTKEAVKEAQNKSLGGATVAQTPPGQHGNGSKQKGILRKVSFGSTQPAKRAKKQNTRQPETDYEQLRPQRKTPNPYRNSSSPSGWDFSPGRGRGRGRGQGASSRGSGCGRGWF